jgi:phospholipid/cholesterol/gamma-HCH transport system permease protein
VSATTPTSTGPTPAPPAQSAWLRWEGAGEASAGVLKLQGSWRLVHLPQIEQALARLPAGRPPQQIDGSGLQELDSAAALVLLRHLGLPQADAAAAAGPAWTGLRPQHARTVEAVRTHLAQVPSTEPVAGPPRPAWLRAAKAQLAAVGRSTAAVGQLLQGHLNFLGGTFVALAAVVRRPALLRLRECTVLLEQCALGALPVVALVTLLIGVVVAYLLGLQAEQYGANIFVVDGVGVGATREFAPLLVAVVVAGRSGAAFAAQLGSMRLTEETDAIRTLGLDLWQVLVVPRVLALTLAMPLLVFVGDVMSLLGAMAVSAAMLDIPPAAFLARLQQTLELRHVLIGLAKAPVFALTIAIIATRMGLTVGRDTRAVGAATTSTVVQGIVAVILLDAGFAVLFQALGL